MKGFSANDAVVKYFSRERHLRLWSSFVLGLLLLGGCVGSTYVAPRSEVVEEAYDRGVFLPSVKEERAMFLEYEEKQEKRLLSLLTKRSEEQFRSATYRVGPGDDVELNVFDVPELNLTVPVRQSGFMSLPLIGAVKASGRTETEIHYELYQRLSSYIRDPQIAVTVSRYGSQKVAVMGAVRRPGMYPLKKGANSILELLSAAGGLSKDAGNYLTFIPSELSGLNARGGVESRARLALSSFNEGMKSNSAIEIYLDQILGTGGGIPLEIPVRGGDMVVIPAGNSITVEGEVHKSGAYDLARQMTLLGALAAAGGITYSAKVEEVEVVRNIGGERRVHYVVSLNDIGDGREHDIRLRNGDIIRVPSHSGRRMGQDTFEGISRLINFGIGSSVPIGR